MNLQVATQNPHLAIEDEHSQAQNLAALIG